MGHSVWSEALGALNFTCSSTILRGCKLKAVSTLGLTTLEGAAATAIGCFAPEFVLDLTISKGPLTLKLKVKSAFVSFEKVSFLITLGASSTGTAHLLILICLPPSNLADLSILSYG